MTLYTTGIKALTSDLIYYIHNTPPVPARHYVTEYIYNCSEDTMLSESTSGVRIFEIIFYLIKDSYHSSKDT